MSDAERCRFCHREARMREWAGRPGWVEIDCPVCGLFRVERRFWAAAHFKQARNPAGFRKLAHRLALPRAGATPPEVPFDGWEALADAPAPD